MNLSPTEASKLTGPQVLKLVMDTVAQEREAAALIAEAMAEKQSSERAKEVSLIIAAQIRERGKA